MIIECIKEGFSLTHKNWQLILIRVAVTLVNLVGLFIFLGIPVFVAIAYLGVDIAHAEDFLPYLLKNPLEFITRYLGLLFLIITALIFYLMFSSLLFLYALSGTLGVLKNSAVNVGYKFNLSSFFREARVHFSRLFWLLSILLLGFTVLVVIFSIFGGIGVAAMQFINTTETSLRMFINSFVTLTSIIFGLIIFFTAIVFIIYSVVASVVEEKRAVDTIKRAFNFLKEKPEAFLFYIILLAGLISANLVLMSFSMIPLIAPVISLLFQGYLSVVLWSSLVVFYVKGTNYPVYSATYDI